jgi:hypothetical protein
MKHPHAVRTVALCSVTAAAELALLAGVTTDINLASPGGAILLGFVLGPPIFLALLAWRRRAHPTRARLLFAVSVVVAVMGVGLLGYDYYRYRTDAAFRLTPGRNPMFLPLVQWVIVLLAWGPIVAAERREKKAKNTS